MVTTMARPRLGAAAALSALLVVLAAASSCAARDFYVGGRDGWTTNPGEPYNRWAERNRFLVNDTLVFRYDKDVDAVLRVSQSHYDACNASEPILRLDGGDYRFVLAGSGPYFFISADAGRCWAGERLIVVVLAVRSPPTPTPKPASSSPAPPPPSPNPASSPAAPPAPSPKSASTSPSPPPAPSPNKPPSSSTPPPPPPVPSPAPSASAPTPPPSSPSAGNVSSPSPAPVTGPPPSKSSAVALRAGVLAACLFVGGAAAIL